MKIRLGEIPSEGRDYLLDRESGELNSALEDLIGARPYAVSMHIKPIGNAYEMRGSVETSLDEVCSKCGYDFEMPVARKFNEIIFQEENDGHRKSQGVHGNQSVNFLGDGPSMIPVNGSVFDAANYAHEAIALSEPFYPTCGPNGSCLHAEEAEEIAKRLALEAEAALGEADPVKVSPFAALKGLSLDSKN